jgi:beta-phosphoglucomutase family hydrolase
MSYPTVDPKAEALIFDLDGTLADSIPIHNACWHEVCKAFNYKYDEQLMFRMTGMPTRKFAEYIKNDSKCSISVDDIMKNKQALFISKIGTIKPIENVVALVKQYHGKYPMAIGTGGGRKSVGQMLDALDLRKYFDVIVTADDVENHKPEPDTFLKCAELMNVHPSKCQVFEDGEPGIKAAQKAGMMVTDVKAYY